MITAIRRRSLVPQIAPVSAPAAPGAHHATGPCFAAVLQLAVQEVEQPDDSDLRRVAPAVPVPAQNGPLIVAGIVVPAPLPR